MRTWSVKNILCLCMAWAVAAQTQPRVFTASDFDSKIQGGHRPRLAVTPDGGFALAFEAFVPRPGGSNLVWQVLVQRFAASGNPLGPTHYFKGETCVGDISVWLSDYVEHAELAFRPDGILLIVLEHEGELHVLVEGNGVESGLPSLAPAGATWQYALLAEDGNDKVVLFMNDAATIRVGIAFDDAVPTTFDLHPNFPNPFNPTTTIAYDLFGREVKTLVDGRQAAGRYTVPFDAEGLTSGTYFYRLEAGAWHAPASRR